MLFSERMQIAVLSPFLSASTKIIPNLKSTGVKEFLERLNISVKCLALLFYFNQSQTLFVKLVIVIKFQKL